MNQMISQPKQTKQHDDHLPSVKDSDKPIVDMLTLRRDLYLVMSLLLADKEVAKIENVSDWTQDFYENEVRRLMLWLAVAIRGLLDKLKSKHLETQVCGEYWSDFPKQAHPKQLTVRQACNSIVHATTIRNYKIPKQESDKTAWQVYVDRITVKSIHRGKKTHGELDIIKFVQIADTLITLFEESTMPTNRDTYKYHFKKGNTIVHTGITYDLDRREAEHQSKHGWGKGHIKQVGFRTTREAALDWEQEQEGKKKRSK